MKNPLNPNPRIRGNFMQKYLLVFLLSLFLLWGGLYAATVGGNSLLGKRAIPQALIVARGGGATYRIEFMGRSVQVGRALLLGSLDPDTKGMLSPRGEKSFSLKYSLPLGKLDLLIDRRNRWEADLRGRKRGGDVE